MVVEKKLAEVEAKLGGIELKLVKTESLTLAQENEIGDLKAALDASEERGNNLGFVDAENFVEPVVHQARNYGFSEGWLVALQAMGVTEDSLLRNLEHVHSQVDAVDEEETLSMREPFHAIDIHVETEDPEVTSNLHAAEDGQGHTLAANQPTGNAPSDEVIKLLPNDPFV